MGNLITSLKGLICGGEHPPWTDPLPSLKPTCSDFTHSFFPSVASLMASLPVSRLCIDLQSLQRHGDRLFLMCSPFGRNVPTFCSFGIPEGSPTSPGFVCGIPKTPRGAQSLWWPAVGSTLHLSVTCPRPLPPRPAAGAIRGLRARTRVPHMSAFLLGLSTVRRSCFHGHCEFSDMSSSFCGFVFNKKGLCPLLFGAQAALGRPFSRSVDVFGENRLNFNPFSAASVATAAPL